MPHTDPYMNRLPVTNPEDFVGRTQILQWLMGLILHDQPQCCAITGLRRIGKTSLLHFLAHPEGARRRFPEYWEQAPEGLLLVYADLSLMGPGAGVVGDAANDVAATMMLGHMLRAVDRQTRGQIPAELTQRIGVRRGRAGEGWQAQHEALVDVLDLLHDAGHVIVFLLDELDVMETLPVRLAQTLRALVIQNQIGYVTASLNPLHELLVEGRTSPLYNLFSTRPLGLLEPDEARALLEEPARARGITWPEPLRDGVLEQSGGHPDLLKNIASQLWHLSEEGETFPSLDALLDAVRPNAQVQALFTSLWGHLDEEEQGVVTALAVGRTQPLPDGAVRALRHRALLHAEALDLFSPLFAEWVAQHSESPRTAALLQLDGRWLTVGDTRHQLTPTEARLAAVLLQHRGHTVSREALQEAIWDEVDSQSKALDTTVQRLREKIEADRANPRWLVTVRGAGYAFQH